MVQEGKGERVVLVAGRLLDTGDQILQMGGEAGARVAEAKRSPYHQSGVLATLFVVDDEDVASV